MSTARIDYPVVGPICRDACIGHVGMKVVGAGGVDADLAVASLVPLSLDGLVPGCDIDAIISVEQHGACRDRALTLVSA